MQTDSNPLIDHIITQNKVLKTMLDTWLLLFRPTLAPISWADASDKPEALLGVMFNSCFELQFVSGATVTVVADLLEMTKAQPDTEVNVTEVMSELIESWLNATFKARLACELLLRATEGRAATSDEFVAIATEITKSVSDRFTNAINITFNTTTIIPQAVIQKMARGRGLMN